MAAQATATFKIKSWDEDRYDELGDGAGLSRASVTQAFSGDIEGDGSVQWLMCYRPDKTADFVGLQRLTGKIGGRSGTVVLTTVGVFDGREARGEWSIVPGSGTGELAGVRGEGGFTAPTGGEPAAQLEYAFE
jgi:Protein of unknown function (DUF3224)